MSIIIQMKTWGPRLCYTDGMGHSKASKANTHARLVETAAARFKERGIDGISLADLMKDLKLTHGGFYKHFGSRDELVTEALELALTETGQAMRERLFVDGKPDVGAFVDFYLNEAHRDERAAGCAVAALAGDAARRSTDVQAQFRKSIEGNLKSLSEALDPRPAGEARATALLVLSTLYGALIMARAVGDSPLSSEILSAVRRRILGSSAAPKKPRRRSKGKRNQIPA
jgi:TetR/AcrR family transcriptional regulator, transcriptional repressor for nem operon